MNEKLAQALMRLDDLEAHVAHQDKTVAELNEVITAQWTKMTALEREVLRLRDELQNSMPQREGPEPPPPHY